MNLFFKIAWRNIRRHKGKSIIIGVILFLGTFLMTIGNGVISGMDLGLQKNIVNCFTGDIVLISDKQESDNVFFEFMGKAVEPIYNYLDIKKVLQKQNIVTQYLPIGKNTAMVLNENGMPGMSFLIGADFEQYKKMFPGNLSATEGKLLEKGERGMMVASGARKEFYDYTGVWVKAVNCSLSIADIPKDVDRSSVVIKDSMVLMGYSNDNSMSDVRLGVKGIIKYKALNTIWGNFVLTDIESFRQCLGYFAASEKTMTLSKEDKELLNTENLDALFSEDVSVEDFSGESKAEKEEIQTVAAETAPVDLDAGAYNMVLVKINKGVKLDDAVKMLNTVLEKEKLGTRAITWKKAIGSLGSMAVLIKGALFVFVMFLFFVAIIIIVNTLSMAAIERTSEIGMMRAVGASKGFIRSMFLAETGFLSFFFGGLGIVSGLIVIKLICLFHITTNNDILQLLYGGDMFHPLVTLPDLGLAVVQLALVTIIAVIYPIKVASGITPLDAISRD